MERIAATSEGLNSDYIKGTFQEFKLGFNK